MQPLDIGTVLTKTFACFRRHWQPFMLLTLVIFLPLLPANLYLISEVETMEQMGQLQPMDPNDQAANEEALNDFFGYFAFFMGITMAVTFLQLCLQSLATGCLVYGTFQDLRNKPVILGECVRVSLRRLPMLVLLSFLMGIAILISFMLCCLPSVITWVFLYLVIPVAVVEGAGLDSFRRSIELVKGSFFPILAIGLIFVVGVGMIGSGVTSQLFALINPFLGVAVGWLTGIAVTTIVGIAQAVSYHDIRAEKEGLVDEDLAAIFD